MNRQIKEEASISNSKIVTLVRKVAKGNPANLRKILTKYFNEVDVEDLIVTYESSNTDESKRTLTPQAIKAKLNSSPEPKPLQNDHVIIKRAVATSTSTSFFPESWGEGGVKLNMLIDVLPKLAKSDVLFVGVKTFIEKAETLLSTSYKTVDHSQVDKLMSIAETYNGDLDFIKIAGTVLKAAKASGLTADYLSRIKTKDQVAAASYDNLSEKNNMKYKKLRESVRRANESQAPRSDDYTRRMIDGYSPTESDEAIGILLYLINKGTIPLYTAVSCIVDNLTKQQHGLLAKRLKEDGVDITYYTNRDIMRDIVSAIYDEKIPIDWFAVFIQQYAPEIIGNIIEMINDYTYDFDNDGEWNLKESCRQRRSRIRISEIHDPNNMEFHGPNAKVADNAHVYDNITLQPVDNEREELFNIINNSYYKGDLALYDFISSSKKNTNRTVWADIVEKLVLAGARWRPTPSDYVNAHDIDEALCNGDFNSTKVVDIIIKAVSIKTIKRTMKELGLLSPISESRRLTRSRRLNEDERTVNNAMKLAKHGEAASQYHLGLMYSDGAGVPKNDTEALKWFRQAADQGHGRACFSIGKMYELGRGVEHDMDEAGRWYALADEIYNNTKPKPKPKVRRSTRNRRLKESYEKHEHINIGKDHRGTPMDVLDRGSTGVSTGNYDIVFDLQKQYGKGNVEINKLIDIIYQFAFYDGENNNTENPSICSKYSKGNTKVQELLLNIYERGYEDGEDDIFSAENEESFGEYDDPEDPLINRYVGGPNLDPELYNEARRPTRSRRLNEHAWFDKKMKDSIRLSKQGDVEAQIWMGERYYDGLGVDDPDKAEALKWYTLAAKQGNIEAQCKVGDMYDDGDGVAENAAEALKWYKLAANQGSDEGQHRMGSMYAGGRGVAQSGAEAVKWYKRAIKTSGHGHGGNSLFCLGELYYKGKIIKQDVKEAVKWYRLAANEGNSRAKWKMGPILKLYPSLRIRK